MVALSQKEGGTLSLERFSLLPLWSQYSVLGWGWLFFFSFFLFLIFFNIYIFFISAQKLQSRTGVVVFSPSAKQLPPVINWLWALDSSVNYILLPSVSGWQYCWPYSCPAPGWRWYTWWSRWPWHCRVGEKERNNGSQRGPCTAAQFCITEVKPWGFHPCGMRFLHEHGIVTALHRTPLEISALQPTCWGTAKARAVQGKRKFSTSYSLTQEICNEVRVPGLPTRPLSLKLFPLEAMSFWWDQVLFLLLEKTRHFWNTCYFKEALREKPISTVVMPVGCRILEGKIPHFFSLKTSADPIEQALKAERKTKQNKNTFLLLSNHVFVREKQYFWQQRLNKDVRVLPYPTKNLQVCFPDH